MNAYALGLVWALGRYDETRQRYIVRCRDRYTVDYLHGVIGGVMLPSYSRTGEQFALRVPGFDLSQLTAYGWTPRNAETRDIPVLDDYASFLRGYFEQHCRPHFATNYVWGNKESKYYRPDIRVYGNVILLTSLINIIAHHTGVKAPSLTATQADKSKVITYGSVDGMRRIYDYLFDAPCNRQYWDSLYKHINTEPGNVPGGKVL